MDLKLQLSLGCLSGGLTNLSNFTKPSFWLDLFIGNSDPFVNRSTTCAPESSVVSRANPKPDSPIYEERRAIFPPSTLTTFYHFLRKIYLHHWNMLYPNVSKINMLNFAWLLIIDEQILPVPQKLNQSSQCYRILPLNAIEPKNYPPSVILSIILSTCC